MKIHELLDSPDKLVLNPWHIAENEAGNPVRIESDNAVRWCIIGAMDRVGLNMAEDYDNMCNALNVGCLTDFLLDNPYPEVIAKLKELDV